jgi:NADPH2:quinone reductase
MPDAEPIARRWLCTALADDFGGLRLDAAPLAACAAGEVRLQVHASALNFPDLLMARGLYQVKPPLPFVPGLECAGVVTAAAADVGWPRIGDRAVHHAKTGAFAEALVVPAAQLRPAPPGFDDAEAAAFGAVAVTAWVALVRRGQLQRGETLLVHGAAGGTGLAAVQLGRHLGATVIATGRSADKLRVAQAAGAQHTIVLEPAAANLRDAVLGLTAGRGADLIFDPVGGDVFDASLRCVAWGGRLLVVGFASGRIGTVPANLPLIKGFSIVGVRAGEYGRRDPERGEQNQRAVEALAARGLLRPPIGARFGFEQLPEAYRALAAGAVAGKIVIEMPPASVQKQVTTASTTS